jgi:hypothetical protein
MEHRRLALAAALACLSSGWSLQARADEPQPPESYTEVQLPPSMEMRLKSAPLEMNRKYAQLRIGAGGSSASPALLSAQGKAAYAIFLTPEVDSSHHLSPALIPSLELRADFAPSSGPTGGLRNLKLEAGAITAIDAMGASSSIEGKKTAAARLKMGSVSYLYQDNRQNGLSVSAAKVDIIDLKASKGELDLGIAKLDVCGGLSGSVAVGEMRVADQPFERAVLGQVFACAGKQAGKAGYASVTAKAGVISRVAINDERVTGPVPYVYDVSATAALRRIAGTRFGVDATHEISLPSSGPAAVIHTDLVTFGGEF